MIQNTMMKHFFQVALIGATLTAGAQNLESAKKDIENENYYRAKNTLTKLLSDPASDKSLVAYYLGNAYLKTDDADSAKIFYAKLGETNKTAYGYLANGRLALLKKDFNAAKELFEKAAITSRNKNTEVLYQIGDAWYKPEAIDLKEAIYNFEQAWKVDAKNSTNTLALGDAYLDNNEGGKAMSKYESAAELNPKLTMAHIKIGRLNVRARIYDDAITAYKKAVELEPENALAHKELGEAYYLSKKYDLAKPELKRYTELAPEDVNAKTNFISFLFQLKEYEQAANEAFELLKEDSTNYILLRSLAYSNYELKRYQDGYAYAQKFWETADPKKVRAADYIYSARLAAQTGDTAKVFSYFAPAIAADSNNADLQGEYAKALYSAKRYEEAAAQYAIKNAKFGASSLDLYYWGRANFSAKKYVDADTTFALFAEKNPTSPDGWLWRAKSKNAIELTNNEGEIKEATALPFYEKYIEIAQADPVRNKSNLIEAYQYLGIYFQNISDKVNAKANLDKAIQLDPNNEFTKELLKGL